MHYKVVVSLFCEYKRFLFFFLIVVSLFTNTFCIQRDIMNVLRTFKTEIFSLVKLVLYDNRFEHTRVPARLYCVNFKVRKSSPRLCIGF